MPKCFLSIYRLKYLISIGIVITLLIGIALLYVLVYSFIISTATIQVQTGFRTILIAVFLSTSFLMVLSSLSGIYGLIRKKNRFVVIYAVTMGLYMFSFLTLGIGTSLTPQFINSQCQQPQTSDYQLTFQAGQDIFCKSSCQCYYSNPYDLPEEELNQMGIVNHTTNSSYPINVQSCQVWDFTQYPLTNQMSWLEMFFNCTGWCPSVGTRGFYVFSNINYGTPNGNCVQNVSDFLATFGKIIEIASFSVGIFIFILLVVICCLWLHPDRGLKYDSMQIFREPLVFLHQEKGTPHESPI